MSNVHFRSLNGLQLRAGADQRGRTVDGYYAVYNNIVVIDGWFQETMMPGAGSEAVQTGTCKMLGGAPIKWLYQHNIEHVLGSVKSGTFKLGEDEGGFRGIGELPFHNLGEQIREQMDRGDTDEASLGFYIEDADWVQGIDVDLLKITKIDVKECSVANWPKNPSAQLSLRAATLPKEIEHKPVVLRALNRYKQNLDPTSEDREALIQYRSLIEPVLPEDLRDVYTRAVPAKKDIFVPANIVEAYLDSI